MKRVLLLLTENILRPNDMTKLLKNVIISEANMATDNNITSDLFG